MADLQQVVENIHVGPGKLKIEDIGGGNPVEFEATEEGATLSISRTLEFIEIAETIGAVGGYVTGEECSLQVTSLEMNAAKLKEVLGHGTVSTIAAGAAQAGLDELEFGGSLDFGEKQLTYTVPRRHNRNLNIIIELYRVVAITDTEASFNKTAMSGYGVQFRAINDMAKDEGKRLGKITIETEEATG